ncbi:family 78 glycoside hydrolase catalytic domain [Jiangella endophytica]|uniref:family 78 glycoside hydrolase catalytic domain n=1 Tax=Jiangella endophytica TaxID=1623398 RepID=UPI0018E57834|nr:family 78 glycoside hydrolase catalytic domain [Jiangella endophytica]
MTTEAAWIWDGHEDSPRNAWRCFVRSFAMPSGVTAAELRITADARYVAYVNGVVVGDGPVRGYTERWRMDTWDISRLLRPTGPNTVAVLVHHPGVSTFSYRRARGGLLAELRFEGDSAGTIGTDGSWLTAPHTGYDSRANRMSMQLGFTELFDARRLTADWTTGAIPDEDGWSPARVIGPAGMAPWRTIESRDIPPLTRRRVTATSVCALGTLTAFHESRVVDLRTVMDPSSPDHANRVAYAGFLVFGLRLTRRAEVTLAFAGGDVGTTTNPLAIGGSWVSPDEFYDGAPRLRCLRRTLAAGDHLVVVDVSRRDHGTAFRVAAHGDATGTVSFVPPSGGSAEFVVIGPLGDPGVPHPLIPDRPLFPRVPAIPAELRAAVGAIRTGDELLAAHPSVRAVPSALVCPVDVMVNSASPPARQAMRVPRAWSRVDGERPVSVPVTGDADCELVFDLGHATTGFVSIEVDAPAGTVIDICGFEWMAGGAREYTIHADNTDNSFRYVARAGRQRYVSPVRRGMRYCQLIVRRPAGAPEAQVVVHDVSVIESVYPASPGSFECSDPVLNDVWRMSQRTVRACMLDVYVDSPVYEQAAWVGDLYTSALSAQYAVGGSEQLTERCLRLAADSAIQTPLINSHSVSGWDNVIPNWTFLWVVACRDLWRRTGDTGFLESVWPAVWTALESFREHCEDGLLDIEAWNFIDWAPLDQPNEGVVTHQNCLLVMALDAATELAAALGRPEAAIARATAAELSAAINATLWSPDADAYIDCVHAGGRRSDVVSVHTQVLAVFSGVATGRRRSRLIDLVADPPPDWVPIGSAWMSTFLYDVLAGAGRVQEMVDLIRRHFGLMLEHGATTCWETFPRARPDGRLTRSHCHAWSATPARFLPASVLGVRPTAAGWSRLLVAPEPVDLAWARGRVPLAGGDHVDVSWTRSGATLDLRVTAPDHIRVDARLPDGFDGTVAIATCPTRTDTSIKVLTPPQLG